MNQLPHRVKNDPAAVLGLPVARIDETDWDECFPAVRDGIVVGVVAAHGGTPMAGDTDGMEYDADRDYYC